MTKVKIFYKDGLGWDEVDDIEKFTITLENGRIFKVGIRETEINVRMFHKSETGCKQVGELDIQ